MSHNFQIHFECTFIFATSELYTCIYIYLNSQPLMTKDKKQRDLFVDINLPHHTNGTQTRFLIYSQTCIMVASNNAIQSVSECD